MRHINVIKLERDLISVFIVDAKTEKETEIAKVNWREDEAVNELEKVMKKIRAKKCRLLVDDNLSYLVKMEIPGNIAKNKWREYVNEQIKGQLPEGGIDLDWDFVALKDSKRAKVITLLIFAPISAMFKEFVTKFSGLKIEIEAVEAVEQASKRGKSAVIGISLKDTKGKDKEVFNMTSKTGTLPSDAGEKEKAEQALEKKLETTATAKAETKAEIEEIKTIGTENTDEELDELADVSPSVEGRWWLYAGIGIVILVAGGFLGWYLLGRNGGGNSTTETPAISKEVTQTPEPTATPSARIDLTKYLIEVQNGSGITGLAGKTAATLEKAGFESVKTANADNYDYTTTVIQTKDGVPEAVIAEIKSALGTSKFVAGETLTDDSDFDVVVIIGRGSETSADTRGRGKEAVENTGTEGAELTPSN